ncbi:MAG: hypothetical protein MZW92_52995 [Comamonadaceae bacterium]|nr:hypothetical protein [Comamonadaceae bacterium]
MLAEGNADAWWLGAIAVLLATVASVVLLAPRRAAVPAGALFGFLAFFILQSAAVACRWRRWPCGRGSTCDRR